MDSASSSDSGLFGGLLSGGGRRFHIPRGIKGAAFKNKPNWWGGSPSKKSSPKKKKASPSKKKASPSKKKASSAGKKKKASKKASARRSASILWF